jgi:hypothetical protein
MAFYQSGKSKGFHFGQSGEMADETLLVIDANRSMQSFVTST